MKVSFPPELPLTLGLRRFAAHLGQEPPDPPRSEAEEIARFKWLLRLDDIVNAMTDEERSLAEVAELEIWP